MKSGLSPFVWFPIIAFILLIGLGLFYYYGVWEGMTQMEIIEVLPVLYDSSLNSKKKITDLMGIPVMDASFNEILNSTTTDNDNTITRIKNYLNTMVSFKGDSENEPSKKKEDTDTSTDKPKLPPVIPKPLPNPVSVATTAAV